MDTAELFRLLIIRTSGPTPPELLHAAGEHARLAPATAETASLLRQLAEASENTPADVLAWFVDHPDVSIRTKVLLHPNLDAGLRLRGVRKERSTIALGDLAKGSWDPAVLAHIAGRKLTGPSSVRIRSELLWNDELPLEAAADLLVKVERQLLDGSDEDQLLIDAAAEAFSNFPGLATRVLTQLTDPQLLLAAGRNGEVSAVGWDHIERVLLDSVTGLVDGAPITAPTIGWLLELLRLDACPGPVRLRIAQTVLAHNGASNGSGADDARRIIATLTPNPHPDGEDPELARLAASSDVADLRMLLARKPLPSHIAWQVALNQAADLNTITAALAHTSEADTDLVALMAAHPSTQMRADICWELGPDSLAAVPAPNQHEVLERIINVLVTSRPGGRQLYGSHAAWAKHIQQLEEDTLLQLPWFLVRQMAGNYTDTAAWLTQRLTTAINEPGAARVFAEVEASYTGPTGSLLAALASASAPAIS